MIEILSNPRYTHTQHSAWYAALTLAERLTTLHLPTGEAENEELATQRLHKWKQQAPFDQEALFIERLAQAHLSEEVLRYLLGESMTSLQQRTEQTPPWLATLLQACADYDESSPFEIPDTLPHTQVSGFLEILKPLLKQGYDRLLAGVEELAGKYNALPFATPDVIDLLFPHLAERLLNVLAKPLTLELNIARLQNNLSGVTPEQRFHEFIEHVSRPDVLLSLLELYPVLARALITMIDYWVAYGLEFLTHLCQDWEDIKTTFRQGPGGLVRIDCGTGDTHRRGRSVSQLTFSSGLKLVYKPRSLATDQHFQILLTWLNERGEHPPLRGVNVLNRGDHGWSEFIEARACTSEAEIICFYQRLGAYLALFYMLGTTDIHFENLIASGEHPMPIDLETLLQPLPLEKREQKYEHPQSLRLLQTSVLRSGLLPGRVQSNMESDGIDISGIGGQGGQRLPRPFSLLTGIGTDEMRFVQQHVTLGGKQNRPMLQGNEVDILNYIEPIVAGFEQIYRLALQHRDELITVILPLFAQDIIRVPLRPTRIYGKLLQESSHPTLLRNMLSQERFFDHLWSTVPQLSFLSRTIPAEQQDLLHGDVPLFTTRSDSCDLFTSRGERIPEFFREPALIVAERTIRDMDERDLARQCWIIRASFASMAMERHSATWKGSELQPAKRFTERAQLIQAARAIGDRLYDLAICGQDEVTWLNLQLVNDRYWRVFITGASLYDGVAGISLFLAYLGAITGEIRYTDLARHTVKSLRKKLSEPAKIPFGPGGFDGWGGLLYLYAHLGTLWQEPALFAEAEMFLGAYQEDIETDEKLDIIGGSAGCILGLLAMYRATSSNQFLAIATRCGNHLLARAQRQPTGLAWQSPLAARSGTPLAGFSHGAAGIAFSLLALAEASGEERFRQAALSALAYEHSLFSPERHNWPDLRDTSQPQTPGDTLGYMVTWCHGAPGIALARLGSLQYLDTPTIREEIAAALDTTIGQGFGANHSLCHGDMGNLDTLLMASLLLDDPRYPQEVARLTPMLLQSIERQGWCTGVPLSIETPGLMTGIAGIGYELLRLAYPELLPSVLLLAPPLYDGSVLQASAKTATEENHE